MANDFYTWAEFVAEVRKLLPIEAQRVGVGSTATDYLTSLIRQACIDLQRVIDGFTINHETIYYPDDMVREGYAMRAVKPPQSKFRDLSIFRILDYTDSTSVPRQQVTRYHARAFPWANRFDLVNGSVSINDGSAFYSIDPAGYTFYAYPMKQGECWMVSLFWDGQKFDFEDEEQVPFSEAAALAVSYFVKANTSLEVEDGIQNAAYYRQMYDQQKTKLHIDDRAKRGI
jgi:hypothetical protein